MARLPQSPEPLTFGECAQCAYAMTGSVATCFKCARGVISRIDASQSCQTCDGLVGNDGRCGNPLCNRNEDARGWKWVWAIGRRTGELQTAINAYKYDGKCGWSMIFGRILVGYLEAIGDTMREYDAIVPMPTFVGPGGRSSDHIKAIVERAALEGPSWPFRTDLIVKTSATPRLATAGSFANRAVVAEQQIGPALTVLDPQWVNGKRILVFDDVFTGGLTLREVARKFRSADAVEVAGIVLARQPFGGH